MAWRGVPWTPAAVTLSESAVPGGRRTAAKRAALRSRLVRRIACESSSDSELIPGVGRDAAYVARHIASRAASDRAPKPSGRRPGEPRGAHRAPPRRRLRRRAQDPRRARPGSCPRLGRTTDRLGHTHRPSGRALARAGVIVGARHTRLGYTGSDRFELPICRLPAPTPLRKASCDAFEFASSSGIGGRTRSTCAAHPAARCGTEPPMSGPTRPGCEQADPPEAPDTGTPAADPRLAPRRRPGARRCGCWGSRSPASFTAHRRLPR